VRRVLAAVAEDQQALLAVVARTPAVLDGESLDEPFTQNLHRGRGAERNRCDDVAAASGATTAQTARPRRRERHAQGIVIRGPAEGQGGGIERAGQHGAVTHLSDDGRPAAQPRQRRFLPVVVVTLRRLIDEGLQAHRIVEHPLLAVRARATGT